MAGFANGNTTGIQPQSPPPFFPSVSVIYINATWLLSLVLSTTSAVLATMTRPWARRYTELPQIPSAARERARVRSFLFLGTQRYTMGLTVEVALILLHLSVFLFYAGLVLFFFTISKTAAMVVLVPVGTFGIVYVTLTLLPLLDHLCPYFTPMTSTLWYLWYALPYLPLSIFRWIMQRPFILLMRFESTRNLVIDHISLLSWMIPSTARLRQHLRDGFQGRIIKNALSRTHHIDVAALTWLFQLPALAEKSKFEIFMVAIPRETILHLFNVSPESGKAVFHDHLLDLLRSCAPGTVELDENMRSRRLSICMDALHHIVRHSVVPYELVISLTNSPLIEMRAKLAKLNLMRALCADGNPAIRMTARSICTLLTKHLLQEWASRGFSYWDEVGESESQWLQDVMEWPEDVIDTLSRHGATTTASLDDMNNMNVDAFVYGILSHQTDDLPIVHATTFTETLATLMNIDIHSPGSRQAFETRLALLIQRLGRGDHEGRDNVVNTLRRMFRDFLRHMLIRY